MFFWRSVRKIVSKCNTSVPCDWSVRFLCQHMHGFLPERRVARLPRNRYTSATFVSWWNLFPELATGRFTPVSDDKCYDLASATTHDSPNPAFVPFFVDKRPHFISFQHIFGFGRQKGLFKFWVGFVFFLAKRPASGDLRQRYARHHACWNALGRQIRSVLSVLRCILVWVPAHRVCHSLCTGIADCHSHCIHFWQYFDYRNFDICKQQVWLSCSHYTTNHFNLTTTQFLRCPFIFTGVSTKR